MNGPDERALYERDNTPATEPHSEEEEVRRCPACNRYRWLIRLEPLDICTPCRIDQGKEER